MKSFGEEIKRYRLEQQLPLRTVSAFLDIDQAILSKIERGHRKATREQVTKLSAFFNASEHDLMVRWLADKVVYEVGNETYALEALQLAEERVLYGKLAMNSREELIKTITGFLKNDGRVSKAWLFGSHARKEDHAESDVDLMISYSEKASGTLLDYADIVYQLEKLLCRKVDLVEEGFVKSFAADSINSQKQLIYG
jgi:predicted nucleotidyltransferase